jgi:hypothetical protein
VLRRVVLRPVVFFAVLARLDAERDLDVPVVERDRVVPDVDRPLLDPDRDLLVPEVERERLAVDLLVPVDLALLVPVEREAVEREDVDRAFAAVAFPPLRPAAFFCAVVPPRLDVERDEARVPEVDREREVVERADVDRAFAAVAFPPLRPAAFFCAVVPPRLDVEREPDFPVVERLRLVVERDELRDVPDLARVVPEVERERVPVVERRGDAARTRETASSVAASSPTVSDGICPPSGSGVRIGSPKPAESCSRLSPSK